MIIRIHETHNRISSQNSIQGNIKQCIANYGVTIMLRLRYSPANFTVFFTMHTNWNNPFTQFDNRTVRVALQRQVQENSHIDPLIYQCILSDTENDRPIRDIICALQDLTIAHACPSGVSRPFMAAATSTPSSTTHSLSQFYSQHKDVQQGLRSATLTLLALHTKTTLLNANPSSSTPSFAFVTHPSHPARSGMGGLRGRVKLCCNDIIAD
jgi:hypothetical protein